MASVGKRVLMLVENNAYSQDIRVKREARALIADGYQVTVICPKPSSAKVARRLNDGVRVYDYPAPRGGQGVIGYAWEYGYSTLMMSVLAFVVWLREGFDVIHAHNPPDMLFLIAVVYKFLGKKFVFDHHDLSPEMYAVRTEEGGNNLMYRLLVRLEQMSCRLADLAIATNESYRNMEMERSDVPPEKIAIVRNGPADSMRPGRPDTELRAKAGTILGYVGIMGPQDGIDYLLRALKHLVYTLGRTDVYCVIIGKSDYLDHLRMLCTEYGLNDYVWFTGWVTDEELLSYLSTADICLDPDPSNKFNDRCTMIKMVEYMALGKPIVAFDLPEHRVSAADAALYAKGNDELDFARKIEQLMDDPARRSRMGEIGRKRIETGLAWSFQADKLLNAYRRLRSDAVTALDTEWKQT